VVVLAGAEVVRGTAIRDGPRSSTRSIFWTCRAAHQHLFGREPEVKSIHAGFEMGIIGEKFPEMDMVSLGTLIKRHHSPVERVKASEVAEFYRFILAALERISEM